MKNLFLLDGVAGTGKSDCIKYIRDGYNGRFKAGVLQKYTTRQKRSEEQDSNHKVDLDFVSEERFQEIANQEGDNFFTYRYGDEKYGYYLYGIRKCDIDKALEDFQDVFLIIRSVACITKLMKVYKNTTINVVPVFIYTDPHLVADRLKSEGYSEEAIKFRTTRSEQVWNEYLSQAIPLYKDILINNSNPNDFHKFIEQLMMKYDQEEHIVDPATLTFSCGDVAYLGRPLIGHRDRIERYLNTYDYSRNVFLMIKYRSNNEDLRKEIKRRIEQSGLHCVIANENDLTNDIYNPIALTYCCKFGIALFDEPEEENMFSPNVAYELGIMQSQGKRCLVVKNESLRGKNFFDILKDEGNWYSKELQLFNVIDGFLTDIKSN